MGIEFAQSLIFSDAANGATLGLPRGVVAFPGRELVVADAASMRVLVFADGRLRQSIGGRGRGRGRFLSLAAVHADEDLLYALDSQRRVVSAWHRDGRLLDEYAIPAAVRAPFRVFVRGQLMFFLSAGQDGALRLIAYRLSGERIDEVQMWSPPSLRLSEEEAPLEELYVKVRPGFLAHSNATVFAVPGAYRGELSVASLTEEGGLREPERLHLEDISGEEFEVIEAGRVAQRGATFSGVAGGRSVTFSLRYESYGLFFTDGAELLHFYEGPYPERNLVMQIVRGEESTRIVIPRSETYGAEERWTETTVLEVAGDLVYMSFLRADRVPIIDVYRLVRSAERRASEVNRRSGRHEDPP